MLIVCARQTCRRMQKKGKKKERGKKNNRARAIAFYNFLLQTYHLNGTACLYNAQQYLLIRSCISERWHVPIIARLNKSPSLQICVLCRAEVWLDSSSLLSGENHQLFAAERSQARRQPRRQLTVLYTQVNGPPPLPLPIPRHPSPPPMAARRLAACRRRVGSLVPTRE